LDDLLSGGPDFKNIDSVVDAVPSCKLEDRGVLELCGRGVRLADSVKFEALASFVQFFLQYHFAKIRMRKGLFLPFDRLAKVIGAGVRGGECVEVRGVFPSCQRAGAGGVPKRLFPIT
jgi:hypothetical protein